MDTIETAQLQAATALLRLLDQRIAGDAVNPPFELANIAVDAIAEHARLVTQARLRQAAENVLIDRLAEPGSSAAPRPDTITRSP